MTDMVDGVVPSIILRCLSSIVSLFACCAAVIDVQISSVCYVIIKYDNFSLNHLIVGKLLFLKTLMHYVKDMCSVVDLKS